MTEQYAIYYSGGSGGYMFFWTLQIALGYNVQHAIKKNWDIKTYATWKRSEQIKFNGPAVNNVYLYCNSNKLQASSSGDITTMLLYTDITTQLKLAELKAAHWFYKPPMPVVSRLIMAANTYNDIELSSNAAGDNSCLFTDCTHSFMLQEVIRTKFKCVCDVLGLAHTQEIVDHIDKWVQLHPFTIQQRLVNKP